MLKLKSNKRNTFSIHLFFITLMSSRNICEGQLIANLPCWAAPSASPRVRLTPAAVSLQGLCGQLLPSIVGAVAFFPVYCCGISLDRQL